MILIGKYEGDYLSKDMADIIERNIQLTEKVLWKGQSEKSLVFTKSDLVLIPVSILWGGITILIELSSIIDILGWSGKGQNVRNSGVTTALSLLPFLAFGLYMMFGRYIYKKRKKQNLIYVVTNKRVMIINKLSKVVIEFINIKNIVNVNVSIRKNGIGTVSFGVLSFAKAFYGNTGMDFTAVAGASITPIFYDVKDARLVYDLVEQLRTTC